MVQHVDVHPQPPDLVGDAQTLNEKPNLAATDTMPCFQLLQAPMFLNTSFVALQRFMSSLAVR